MENSSGFYLSIADHVWHVNMPVHTALDELHVIFCQSPGFVCKYILHLEMEQSVTIFTLPCMKE